MGSTAAVAEWRIPLEPEGKDFPYYRGCPDTISTRGWLRVLLFVGLPVLGLRMASPSGWTAIFARVGLREVKLMFAFALLNIVITMVLGAAINFFGTAKNLAQ